VCKGLNDVFVCLIDVCVYGVMCVEWVCVVSVCVCGGCGCQGTDLSHDGIRVRSVLVIGQTYHPHTEKGRKNS